MPQHIELEADSQLNTQHYLISLTNLKNGEAFSKDGSSFLQYGSSMVLELLETILMSELFLLYSDAKANKKV